MLLTWNHNSGFNVHTKGRIDGADGEAIEKVARYMSRAAISVERVELNSNKNTVTLYEKQDRSPSCKQANYTILEFIALLAGHIPSPYETITFYYGQYSSSYRGKEKRENISDEKNEVEEVKGAAKASSRWARLIYKIFEVDPLRCKKCGGEMKVIAFITQRSEVMRILNHIGEETIRPPPPKPDIKTDSHQHTWFADYIPPVEAYFQDADYLN